MEAQREASKTLPALLVGIGVLLTLVSFLDAAVVFFRPRETDMQWRETLDLLCSAMFWLPVAASTWGLGVLIAAFTLRWPPWARILSLLAVLPAIFLGACLWIFELLFPKI